MVLPQNFGKYDVVGVLGAGAMGTVYDCVDPVIGRRVAIKTVLKHTLDASEARELLDRFKQEAQAGGRLNHPGVCSIYDYGETDYVAYIAMEYISGKELKKYFDDGEKFDLKEIVRIMTEILDALDHAHRNKVVHRDIKPANIMVTEDGRIKVADFGVAKIESSMLTQVGTKVGTPAYMSPEQHKGLTVDGRSDLFSCGVILYQFLTGARPFTGGSQTVAQEILTRLPTPPSEINTSLTPIWDAIAKKALAKRRDERYLTARDFVDALTQGLNDAPGGFGVPFQATPRSPSESSNIAERSGTGTNTGNADRTNLAMESELEFWKEIKDSDIEEDFAAFVDSFPDGRFSHIAKRRLDKLRVASDRSQSGHDAPRSAPAVTSPAPSAAGPARDEADDDRTQMSSNADERAKAEVARLKREAEEKALRDAAAKREAKAEPGADVDATMIQSKAAEAIAEPDADATFIQKLDKAGSGAPGADGGTPDSSGSDAIDFDLSEGALAPVPASPIDSGVPSAAPVAPVTHKVSNPAQPPVQAKIHSAAESAPASPPVTPINSGAPSVAPVAPAAPVTAKAASPAQAPGGAIMLATIQATTQSTDSPAAAPAATPAAAAVAESAAPVAPVAPKEQVFLAEEPQTAPQAKKSPVPMMAGVMLALAAVGAGWFMFGSTPTPSSKGPESAARETKPAQTQDSGAGQRQQNAGPDKSVTTPSTQADNANAAAAKKANDAAEQKKAELAAQKLAEEKAAAKSAADKVASDKLASGKAAAEKAAADKTNAAKLATDKAAADKQAALDQLAADKAAADKRVADKAAADKAVADKAAADKLASEKAAVSAVASAGSIADRIAAASGPAELYKRAVALRNDGKASQAVALLRQASSQGHGPSSRLLAVIFTDGSGDVRANFREVERYKALAETQGER